MLLLNLTAPKPFIAANMPFTFQYASIKPPLKLMILFLRISFTFQYASIKPCYQEAGTGYEGRLHFNMLLLNQEPR